MVGKGAAGWVRWEHWCVWCTCTVANADRQLGSKNNEIQMTAEGEASDREWAGEERGGLGGRPLGRQTRSLQQRGSLMKMSTLLGIFQDPDADLPFFRFAQFTQSSAEADTKSRRGARWGEGEGGGLHLPVSKCTTCSAAQDPRPPTIPVPCKSTWCLGRAPRAPRLPRVPCGRSRK